MKRGFTIVELLIVIVVIAILAAITIVAYSGIQQRANNAAVIAAAQQTVKLIKSYQAVYGNYPLSSSRCYSVDNQCTDSGDVVQTSDNSSVITELRKIGEPVGSIPRATTNMYGLFLNYNAPRTYNHSSVPGLLMYNLKGVNQDCKLNDVVVSDPAPLAGETNAFITSSTGYTVGNSGGNTRCWVSV